MYCCYKVMQQLTPCSVTSYPIPGQFVTLCIPLNSLKYFLHINYKDHIKKVTLKGNVSNVMHQYHFNTNSSGTTIHNVEKNCNNEPRSPRICTDCRLSPLTTDFVPLSTVVSLSLIIHLGVYFSLLIRIIRPYLS